MLLNSKKLAFLGILLSVTVLFIILSGVFEFNTLFLLGAASFGVGIAIRESGLRIGAGFYFAALILSLILAPNKLYCITFSLMGLYVLIEEFTFEHLTHRKTRIDRKKLFWFIKYTAFNLMLLPALIFLPKLIYQGDLNKGMILAAFFAAQFVLLVYDMAYNYFQKEIWGKVRRKLDL